MGAMLSGPLVEEVKARRAALDAALARLAEPDAGR